MLFTNCAETMEGFEFDIPTMVKFQTKDDEVPFGGIAYGTEIICGCCGGTVPFEDCVFIETMEWINISDEIMGDWDKPFYDDFDTQIQIDEYSGWEDMRLGFNELAENP